MVAPLDPSPGHLRVRFRTTDGVDLEAAVWVPAGVYVTNFEILAPNGPIVAMPFALHDDSRRYHTICRRRTPEIEELER